jgi:hypothetical protein
VGEILARAKVRTASQFECDNNFEISVRTFDSPLSVRKVDSIFGANFLDIRSGPHRNEAEALLAGKRIEQILLLAGIKHSFGAHFGHGIGLSYSEEVHAAFRAATGEELIPDRIGITVYEKPASILGFHAQGSAIEQAANLAGYMNDFSDIPFPLTERQRIAAELLNDSFFEPSPDSMFLLSVTAIEVLCPAAGRSAFFQRLVDCVVLLVKSMEKILRAFRKRSKADDAADLIDVLVAQRKRASIGGGIRAKLGVLLGNEIYREFMKLYRRRSKFVHEGLGRGTFVETASRGREIAKLLLFADIAQEKIESDRK